MKNLSASQKKTLRRLAHDLSPVVQVGKAGVNDAVLKELDRALTDHELIKIKFSEDDRDVFRQGLAELAAGASAQIVHKIGRTAVLFRASDRQLISL